MNQNEKILTIKEVEKMWDNMTKIYYEFDSSPQSFYYAIISMMELRNAKHILEIGCGRCLLLLHCLQLIKPETTYLATDLSSKMIQIASQRIKNSLQRFSCGLSFEQWCKKNNLTLKVANGEEEIETQRKFDRIICNMVLMLTENPEKMLRSMYNQAEKGCILGISVWGRRQLNLIQQQLEKIVTELKIQAPRSRSNFHLYNKVAEIAEPIGWKLIVSWQQVSVFPCTKAEDLQNYLNASLSKMVYLTQEQKKWVHDQYNKRQEQRLGKKKEGLTFPAQIYIFKKQ